MISKNFARCLAKISGDGNLYYRYIRYSNTSRILLQEFKEDIRKVFGNVKFTEGKVNSGTPFIQIHGKAIIGEFKKYMKSYKSDDIIVPDVIMNGSKAIQREYLRAFYDDEGSPNLRLFKVTKEWKRNINLCSNSIRLLKDIKILLLESFGIETNRIFKNKNNDDYDRSFVLSVTGKDNFIKFKECVGFKIPYKQEKLDLMIKSYGNTFSRNREGFDKIKEKLGSCSQC